MTRVGTWPEAGRRKRGGSRGFRFLLCAGLAGLVGGSALASEAPREQLRLGFSSATFTDLNENDARAGIKVWAQALLKERGIPVDPVPVILKDFADVGEALQAGRVDMVTLNTDEIWAIGRDRFSGEFVGGVNEGSIFEEYVLLVRQESAIRSVGELRGRSLLLHRGTRMSLAPYWLDTVLARENLPRAERFCRVTTSSKLTKVVLPVFFGQSDACIVTRRGFKTMAELNPQVGQRLRVLLQAPKLVPTGFLFRKDYRGEIKAIVLAEFARIKDSPAGAQVLALFQSDSLEAQGFSCLDSAFALLEEHAHRMGATGAAKRETVAAPEGGVVPGKESLR